MNASVFYTRRSWTLLLCFLEFLPSSYLQLWGFSGSTCRKETTRRVSNPQLVPNIPDAGLRPAEPPTFSGAPAAVHAWRGALGMCVFFPPLLATTARVAATNLEFDLIFLYIFFSNPSNASAPRHKVSIIPFPTYSGSSSCKSLLASHCAVSQSNVSSSDCAINTSEWLLPLCSINMRTLV